MPWCHPCDRWFGSDRSYNQHVENSNVHREDQHESSDEEPEFECLGCDNWYWTNMAREEHHVHEHGDRYCQPCNRMFRNENNLMQHLHSRIHQGASMKCPFCPTQYPTASALIIHLESGRCPSGSNRQKINAEIRRLDRDHVITTRLIEYPSSSSTNIATSRSWNGSQFECALCYRGFNTLQGLNSHLKSPVHQQKMYKCPGARCGKEFIALSGLVQHVESESCGVMRFSKVQSTARGGVGRMVGKMIGN
ncbi:putative zinc finger protein [Botrytis fragariae]|uniref:Putative zinc finger protein n=1 Tax=Botrytis fragariae TaxID=1964551 RepID=A0A8H6B449_9HELO|nr:putative zinc finger protein [Botrytis fragariae]KAF5878845.1 putative zinc finger protein [Botrytis fragariae]